MGELITHQADVSQLAEAIVTHQRTYRVSRRSLKLLAVESPVVRNAHADSRTRQIAQIALWEKTGVRSVVGKTRLAGQWGGCRGRGNRFGRILRLRP